MRQILTLTLNPALDLATETEALVPNRKLRCAAPRLDPGGGGINVSRAIARLGGVSTAMVALGGATGETIAALLADEGVEIVTISVPGLTRQSFAVTARDSGAQYRFVLPGPGWPPQATDRLFDVLARRIGPEQMLVVSGSLPPGLSGAVLVRLAERCQARGAEMLLDTSGAALAEAISSIEEVPFGLLRMDGAEADELAGRGLSNARELAAFGKDLVRSGKARRVVLSLGASGTLGVSATESFFCDAPPVELVSAVGAGDSLLGATALALAQRQSFRAALRAGTGAAAAAVTTPATQLCDGALARRLVAEVRVRDLE
ncbi:1-phosphofructokinase family hexose kinase [Limimaricola sp. G21655-S1]|uniref:1-phosphofructokinase family hexose kinase n=1 Tax=Limimaricola sp. G21655-S1 TaxID=3014768 RepID=UPI0022AFED61|nr:1-phosphofructokinase family hexose kinase [Limimaricola sp. G21655-S1]MCZ4259768.1 1-phosphofructokinase family hexose kinase [Limimaricola sp. G21655-S1]